MDWEIENLLWQLCACHAVIKQQGEYLSVFDVWEVYPPRAKVLGLMHRDDVVAVHMVVALRLCTSAAFRLHFCMTPSRSLYWLTEQLQCADSRKNSGPGWRSAPKDHQDLILFTCDTLLELPNINTRIHETSHTSYAPQCCEALALVASDGGPPWYIYQSPPICPCQSSTLVYWFMTLA